MSATAVSRTYTSNPGWLFRVGQVKTETGAREGIHKALLFHQKLSPSASTPHHVPPFRGDRCFIFCPPLVFLLVSAIDGAPQQTHLVPEKLSWTDKSGMVWVTKDLPGYLYLS